MPKTDPPAPSQRFRPWLFWAWVLLIAGFASLRVFHLQADFPDRSPWVSETSIYTDEGWYGSAAIRAHVLGHWDLPGDMDLAPVTPLLPAVEWVVFSFTGVTLEAARSVPVACFFANLFLAYLLLRTRSSRWTALLALSLLAASPFHYCYSRLAIVEPLLTTVTLGAVNVAVRVHRLRHPVGCSACLGALFALMMLTKPTAFFLLPALAWACLQPLWENKKLAAACALAAAGSSALIFGLWMSLLVWRGVLSDYLYIANNFKYPKTEFYWPVISFIKTCYFGFSVDRFLVPVLAILAVAVLTGRKRDWARELWDNPAFGASFLAAIGFCGFMVYYNNASIRYYTLPFLFAIVVLALSAESLLNGSGWTRRAGWALVLIAAASALMGARTSIQYALHPKYTFVEAAQDVARFIDDHPNGNRLLLSDSGDDIMLMTHLPALCDEWGTEPLASKVADYNPGWLAVWNRLDPEELEAIHRHDSLEQVASFHAFTRPDRNLLVLFKLHALNASDGTQNDLKRPLPEDRIGIPVAGVASGGSERMRHRLIRKLRALLP